MKKLNKVVSAALLLMALTAGVYAFIPDRNKFKFSLNRKTSREEIDRIIHKAEGQGIEIKIHELTYKKKLIDHIELGFEVGDFQTTYTNPSKFKTLDFVLSIAPKVSLSVEGEGVDEKTEDEDLKGNFKELTFSIDRMADRKLINETISQASAEGVQIKVNNLEYTEKVITKLDLEVTRGSCKERFVSSSKFQEVYVVVKIKPTCQILINEKME